MAGEFRKFLWEHIHTQCYSKEQLLEILLCSQLFLDAVLKGLEKIPKCWIGILNKALVLSDMEKKEFYKIVEVHNEVVSELIQCDTMTLCTLCKRSGCDEHLKYTLVNQMPDEIRPCRWVVAGKPIFQWNVKQYTSRIKEGNEYVTIERTKVLQCPQFSQQNMKVPLKEWKELKQSTKYPQICQERKQLAKLTDVSAGIKKRWHNGHFYFTCRTEWGTFRSNHYLDAWHVLKGGSRDDGKRVFKTNVSTE